MQRQLMAELVDDEQDDAGAPHGRCWLRGAAIGPVDQLASSEIAAGARGLGGGSSHEHLRGRWVTDMSREFDNFFCQSAWLRVRSYVFRAV